jgi:hypothetical protein
LCKEHDAVDNDEKMIVLSNKKERYNIDFTDLHIINICNEENESIRTSID